MAASNNEVSSKRLRKAEVRELSERLQNCNKHLSLVRSAKDSVERYKCYIDLRQARRDFDASLTRLESTYQGESDAESSLASFRHLSTHLDEDIETALHPLRHKAASVPAPEATPGCSFLSWLLSPKRPQLVEDDTRLLAPASDGRPAPRNYGTMFKI